MFFKTFGYDVVFGSSLLNTVLLKKLFRIKTKFVLLNISLSRLVISNKDKKIKFKIIKWLLKDIDAVVCLSSAQKQQLEELNIIDDNKIFFAHLGVDDIFYNPIYENRNNILLAVGRDNGRDYKTIIEVAKTLPQYKFEIICSKRNIEGQGALPRNVIVHYDISNRELRDKYQTYKALLLITHSDEYGDGADCSGQTVLLDAMASGIPIIASKKEYLKDYVGDGGEEVELVNFYDIDGLKGKIIDIQQDSQKSSKMAQNARNRVERGLSTKSMALELSAVFKQII